MAPNPIASKALLGKSSILKIIVFFAGIVYLVKLLSNY